MIVILTIIAAAHVVMVTLVMDSFVQVCTDTNAQ